MQHAIGHVTDDTFEAEVLRSGVPVLLDFWAEWCGPCKMIAPVLEETATHYGGRLRVLKINVDENAEAPARYRVRGIPTLMLFDGGEMIATKVGAVSRSQLEGFIEASLRDAMRERAVG